MSDVNLDSLLDTQLDDLKDLPEFKVFPPGAHRCTINSSTKEINSHPAVEAKLTLISHEELSDATAEACEAGTECSVAYMLDNEFGQGNLKKTVAPLAAHFGTTSLRDTFEAAKGAEVLAVTKTRQNKEKTQTYLDIVSLQVV